MPRGVVVTLSDPGPPELPPPFQSDSPSPDPSLAHQDTNELFATETEAAEPNVGHDTHWFTSPNTQDFPPPQPNPVYQDIAEVSINVTAADQNNALTIITVPSAAMGTIV